MNDFVEDFKKSLTTIEEFIGVNMQRLIKMGLDEGDVRFFLQLVSLLLQKYKDQGACSTNVP